MNTDTPRLNSESHRLTDLPGECHPFVCRSCGGSCVPKYGNGLMRLSISRWQEHDHNDKPEPRIIVLCSKCSDRMIEPHPRLYKKLEDNDPWPGAMEICLDCKFRSGTSCSSPDAKANGGNGVMLTIAKPFTGFIDGPKYSGPFVNWPKPAEACKQKV
jgi:hypothetical protein